MTTRTVDFWFEFGSTYSYPAAMRLAPLARAVGITVRWRPFMLGPIFRDQGWDTSPFNLYPAKGRNMWRGLERISLALEFAVRAAKSLPAKYASCRQGRAHWTCRKLGRGLLPRHLSHR